MDQEGGVKKKHSVWHEMVKHMDSGSRQPGFKSWDFLLNRLCGHAQITQPLHASVSSYVKYT